MCISASYQPTTVKRSLCAAWWSVANETKKNFWLSCKRGSSSHLKCKWTYNSSPFGSTMATSCGLCAQLNSPLNPLTDIFISQAVQQQHHHHQLPHGVTLFCLEVIKPLSRYYWKRLNGMNKAGKIFKKVENMTVYWSWLWAARSD